MFYICNATKSYWIYLASGRINEKHNNYVVSVYDCVCSFKKSKDGKAWKVEIKNSKN